MRLNEIELWYEPRKTIIPQLTLTANHPKMTEFESAFVCGILREYRPEKILEVGIAAGGTTAIIMQAMTEVRPEGFEMYSIDYSEHCWDDSSKKSGYLGEKAKQLLKKRYDFHHEFFLGTLACAKAEEIGKGVDCLILDTIHYAPGELLELITLLPYLKDGCVVICHDIAMQYYSHRSGFATTLTMGVAGEKILNWDDARKESYPNIGAFIVDAATLKYVENLFFLMMVPWKYLPSPQHLKLYRDSISQNYEDGFIGLFDKAARLNQKDALFEALQHCCGGKGKRVVVYGAGSMGRTLVDRIEINGFCEIAAWVDQNYRDKKDDRITSPEDIRNLSFDFVCIAIREQRTVMNVAMDLSLLGVAKEKIITALEI